MKFDVIGRIHNMRLPDGKTAILYSVYEAVSNSIHAINDRFGEAKAAKKGRVGVVITEDGDGDISSISITDNGIGFTSENIESFETSDKQIKTLADGSDSAKEPDIVFFNPLGFRREGTNDPVVIVEFKRPGDEVPSKHPIDQVLGYIDELRGSKVRDMDGGVVSDITERTPFECIIVCELTDATRKLCERSIAQHPTPDGEGFFGYSRPHNATIRVISFAKMVRDAEKRNQAFFDQLKLDSPSSAAKKRAAKARAKQKAQQEIITVPDGA